MHRVEPVPPPRAERRLLPSRVSPGAVVVVVAALVALGALVVAPAAGARVGAECRPGESAADCIARECADVSPGQVDFCEAEVRAELRDAAVPGTGDDRTRPTLATPGTIPQIPRTQDTGTDATGDVGSDDPGGAEPADDTAPTGVPASADDDGGDSHGGLIVAALVVVAVVAVLGVVARSRSRRVPGGPPAPPRVGFPGPGAPPWPPGPAAAPPPVAAPPPTPSPAGASPGAGPFPVPGAPVDVVGSGPTTAVPPGSLLPPVPAPPAPGPTPTGAPTPPMGPQLSGPPPAPDAPAPISPQASGPPSGTGSSPPRRPEPSGPPPAAAPGDAKASGDRDALIEQYISLRDQVASAALQAQMADALASVGVTPVEPDPGEPFDRAHHQAVDFVPTDDPILHRTVSSVERPGYLDGERLIRPAQVVVYRHDAPGGSAPDAPPAADGPFDRGDGPFASG